MSFATQLPPHFPRAIYLMILVPDSVSLNAQHVVPLSPCTPLHRIRVLGLVQKVGRRGDRHRGADQLDPVHPVELAGRLDEYNLAP